MENFKTHITESKNTHMTHIEDKVLYGGVNGTRQAILALRSLRDMLKGEHDGSVSVKWDGAPAIFAGIDPSDGNFFVAKKGIFNKNPKVYKSAADVDADAGRLGRRRPRSVPRRRVTHGATTPRGRETTVSGRKCSRVSQA